MNSARRSSAFSAAQKAIAALACALLPALGTASAQDPTATLPNNYRLIFENSSVAVIHAHYEPHEKIPLHDHSKFPTVYVYLSDSGPVLFSHVEAHPFSYTRRPVKLGAYRVSPGRIEKHSVENKGDIPTDFLRVELKQLPIRHFTDEFRGQPPAKLSNNLDVTEFSNSDLATERIVCIPGSSCAIKSAPFPSLIIAFTAAELAGDRAIPSVVHMKAGTVKWMDAGDSLSVRTNSTDAAHMLRILFRSDAASKSTNFAP